MNTYTISFPLPIITHGHGIKHPILNMDCTKEYYRTVEYTGEDWQTHYYNPEEPGEIKVLKNTPIYFRSTNPTLGSCIIVNKNCGKRWSNSNLQCIKKVDCLPINTQLSLEFKPEHELVIYMEADTGNKWELTYEVM